MLRPAFFTCCLLLLTALAWAQPRRTMLRPGIGEQAAADRVAVLDSLLDSRVDELATARRAWEVTRLELFHSRLLSYGVPVRSAAAGPALDVVAYDGFIVGHAAAHGLAQWVYHVLPADIWDHFQERPRTYREDRLLAGGARLEDYENSGFQRGHLAPAADFRWSAQAIEASFTLANVAPQTAAFNEGLWLELEKAVRRYQRLRPGSDLFVVTGPLLRPGLPQLKDTTGVSIPEYFYKVVMNPELRQGIAFLVEADPPSPDGPAPEKLLEARALTIDSLEALSGLDFFPNLPSSQANAVEGRVDLFHWLPQIGLPPVSADRLPPETFNTEMINEDTYRRYRQVMGTVTEVRFGKGAAIYLDRFPPYHHYWVLIQKRHLDNFNRDWLESLVGQTIIVENSIIKFGDTFFTRIGAPERINFPKLRP